MASAYDDGILAVIRCGLDQGMEASAFGGDERAAVLAMARRGKVRIVSRDKVWVYATLPDPTLTLRDRTRKQEISLTLRGGVVVGAVGCEPQRYVGLTEARARALAEGGPKALAEYDQRPNPALMGVRSQWAVDSSDSPRPYVLSGEDADILARVHVRDMAVHHPSVRRTVREILTPLTPSPGRHGKS